MGVGGWCLSLRVTMRSEALQDPQNTRVGENLLPSVQACVHDIRVHTCGTHTDTGALQESPGEPARPAPLPETLPSAYLPTCVSPSWSQRRG